MVTPGNTAGIRARQIPQAVRFLRKLGVPAPRIAGILGESADNIRHIDSRAYQPASSLPAATTLQGDDLALLRFVEKERLAQVRRNLQGIRIRTKLDLEQAEATIWSIFRSHQSVGLEEGYEALLLMLPGVANARHGHVLKVRLLIEEKLAWFAQPLDHIAVALAHAQAAMGLGLDAFRESAGEKQYLLRYTEAALIASICLQKMHQPEQAFSFIQAADEANGAAGQLPGSEHLRQRGASFIQMGSSYDELAKRAFLRAPKRMERRNEFQQLIDIEMNGLRQRAYVEPAAEWDNVQHLTAAVTGVYGKSSMQYAVAAKSAAAVGLKLVTPASTLVALRLLDSISPVPSSSISKGVPHILSMTPELGLNAEDTDRWLRFALNEAPSPRK